MYRFTYTRGQWSDGIDLPEWDANEEMSEFLSRIGFTSVKQILGSEHGANIEIFEGATGHTFYAIVSPLGNTCYEVLLPDFPSLMSFIREFGPTFSNVNLEGELAQIATAVEKFFRATHGHDAHGICKECSPHEWRMHQERREAARAAKDAIPAGD